MVQRPLRPCTTPGCPYRCDGGRCPACKTRRKHPDNDRALTWTTVYGRDWPRRRLEYLTAHPVCVLCGHLAGVPDHHPRGVHLLKRLGIVDFNADRYLRPLCVPCHNRETAKQKPAGWYRDRLG